METSPLDKMDEILRIDKNNMLTFCTETPKYYAKATKTAQKLAISYYNPSSIVIAGMGGSAISGDLLKDWARDKIGVPIEVSRGYSLPAYADKNTLVIVMSYSGETEESLSAFLDATKRKCMTVGVSSGGTLQRFAMKLGSPHLSVPAGMPPRAALPFMFIPLPILLEKAGLISDVASDISEATSVLKKVSNANSPEKPMEENKAKSLATNLCGTIPVVYASGFYRGVAKRFKTQFNENSKVPAKCEVFPELNHNEIMGWEEHSELSRIMSAVIIRDKNEPEEVRSRIEVTEELMQPAVSKIVEVWAQGESGLAKMLSTIVIGDFTSVYLAILRKTDPTPVKTIESLKERMKQTGLKAKIIRELYKLTTN